MAESVEGLREEVASLRREIDRLRQSTFAPSARPLVRSPAEVQSLFDQAESTIGSYFQRMHIDPAQAMIGVEDERYLLVRASAFSLELFDSIVQLYADRGPREALAIGRGFLFDIAHTIGLQDARTLHARLGNMSPLEKLSGGPVHFAYTGWALVDIKPSSSPTPDDEYCLVYDHPYSFEAASWMKAGRVSEGPVCIMNAGYSSGWCTASFGLELTAIEVTCKARGDATCSFVMAPPHRVAERVRQHFDVDLETIASKGFEVPTYFERKRAEEELRESLRRLKSAQDELVRKERLATVGLLVAGVAHEVNTPLGVAVTAMSVVADQLAELRTKFEAGELTKGALREFLERTQRASGMVETNLSRAAAQITSFKRVSVDQVTHERRRVDLAEYLRHTVESLGPIVRRHALDVQVACEGDLDVVTHPGAFAQVVTNFVTNSAAHGRADEPTEDGAPRSPLHIGIALQRRGDTLVLRYHDAGRGMAPDVARQAFQPFFTTARGGGGTGLGLHIVHSLVVDVLGGRIELDTAAGRGVRFEIEFPALEDGTRR